MESVEPRRLFSTFVVNTTSDALNPGTGLMSLREAISLANAHVGSDTITFDASVFASPAINSITLTQGQLKITDTAGTTTIIGPASGSLSISATGLSRVLRIGKNAGASISGLTFTGGKLAPAAVSTPSGSNPQFLNGVAQGAGISNAGNLTLIRCSVTNNTIDVTASDAAALGAGIYNAGSLTIANSTISNNTLATGFSPGEFAQTGATQGAGIYSRTSLTISGSTITNNLAGATPDTGGDATGGGIFCNGALGIFNSTVSQNQAIGGSGTPAGSAAAGGIFAQTLNMDACSVTDNTAESGIDYSNASTSNASAGGIGAATAAISNSFITNNTCLSGDGTSIGGGLDLQNATLLQCIVSGNRISSAGAIGDGGPASAQGAGIYCALGNVSILQSSILGNIATGVASTQDGSTGGFAQGGGVYSNGALIVNGSTFASNAADGAAGVNSDFQFIQDADGGDGSGGALYVARGTAAITNSTFTLNTATGGAGANLFADQPTQYPAGKGGSGYGGAIFTSGAVTLNDSTISGNTASAGAGGSNYGNLYFPAGAAGLGMGGGITATAPNQPLANNTIIAGNSASSGKRDVDGTLNASSAFDLLGRGGGLTAGVHGIIKGVLDPMLGALSDNGGPTQTLMPIAGSPVIDAGSNSVIPSGLAIDQRGNERIFNNTVDIGAVETQPPSTISGIVFDDANANGSQDSGEAGAVGVTVYLDTNGNGVFDPGEESTTTDASGNFMLNVTSPGTYILRIVPDTGDRITTPLLSSYTISVGPGPVVSVNNLFGETPIAS